MKKLILILLGILAALWILNLDKALAIDPTKSEKQTLFPESKSLIKDSAFSVDFTNLPNMVSLDRIAKGSEKFSKVQNTPKERLVRVLSD